MEDVCTDANRVSICGRWVEALKGAVLSDGFFIPHGNRKVSPTEGGESFVNVTGIKLIFHLVDFHDAYANAEGTPMVFIEVSFWGRPDDDIEAFVEFVSKAISSHIKRPVQLTPDDHCDREPHSVFMSCDDSASAWNIAEYLLEQNGY